jgi:hypothetical protein
MTSDKKSSPLRVRLPGFILEDEIPLGDVIKRATSWAGVKPCGGCGRRVAALNDRVVFTPRSKGAEPSQ